MDEYRALKAKGMPKLEKSSANDLSCLGIVMKSTLDEIC